MTVALDKKGSAPGHLSRVPRPEQARNLRGKSRLQESTLSSLRGGRTFPMAAFYSYAYPEPEGFRNAPLTAGAYYDATLGEFILPTIRSVRPPTRKVHCSSFWQ
jgi:hypothetical protein